MSRKRLIWQLFPPSILVSLASLVAIIGITSTAVREFHIGTVRAGLESQAALLAPEISRLLAEGIPVDPVCKRLGETSGTRITVVLPSGEVAGDSHAAPESMDAHAGRPEIVNALTRGRGFARRYSDTQGQDMLYHATALTRDGATIGLLRTALPARTVDEQLAGLYMRIALGALLFAAPAGLISWFAARRVIRPLNQIQQGAERFAKGELTRPLPIPESEEFAILTESLNAMAAQLDDRLRTHVRQRNQHEAILASMVEGVLAVDTNERIISLNRAAARLIGVDPARAYGQNIQTTVRNTALQRFLREAAASDRPLETEIAFHHEGEQILQAHGSVLRDANGQAMGAVVVLNDVTRMRRLEAVRRDFVANVSHELRTPITSIKGFIETLLDGGLHSPEDTERFLGIMARQADRLNAIIEDLLTLSRIEQEEEAEDLLAPGSVREAIENAVQVFRPAADARNIALSWEATGPLETAINPRLLEQGIGNLIDNAIKYSEPGSQIRVNGGEAGGEIVVRVEDQGCGVKPDLLPRLFERFYRVDKARSRNVGGTGLGLAIVKHIAQSHGGRVSVESEPGVGSTFAIHLPIRRQSRSSESPLPDAGAA